MKKRKANSEHQERSIPLSEFVLKGHKNLSLAQKVTTVTLQKKWAGKPPKEIIKHTTRGISIPNNNV